jgi:hypothetical protein
MNKKFKSGVSFLLGISAYCRIYFNMLDADLNYNKIFSFSKVESRSEVSFLREAFVNIISRMGLEIPFLTLWDPTLHRKRQ